MDSVISNCSVLSDVTFFREKMSNHNFIFSYRGKMSQSIVKNLLSLTEKKIDALNEGVAIKNKIFGVMINCLQSICSNDKEKENSEETIFMINKQDDGYVIFNGVYMNPSNAKAMCEIIETINSMSSDSLSDLRKEKLMEMKEFTPGFSIDESSLGLINIAKKTGRKIGYNVEHCEERDFFAIQIQIN